MPYRLATPQDNLSVGVSKGFRTHDLQSHNLALYQLSYTHHKCGLLFQLAIMVRLSGNPSSAQLVRVSREHYVKIHRDPHQYGASGGIRTPDLCLRRALLYPAELQTHTFDFFAGSNSCIFRLSLLVDQQGLEPWTP